MIDSDYISIIGPALLAGLLVISTHVPLGQEVLKRGIIFIDLAIAQIAALGAIFAKLFLVDMNSEQGHSHAEFGIYLSFAFALGAAWLFKKTEQKFAKQQEAVIGSVFVVASSLSLLMLADHPHGGEEIQHMLAGQILWINWKLILIAAAVYAPILWLCLAGRLKPEAFYYIFAITITISVQMVGVFLVFACLILPALAVVNMKKQPLVVAYMLAFIGLISGLAISTITDLPTGPVIICCLAVFTAANLIKTSIR